MPDITLGIFILTYVGMAIGRIPGLRTDRAGLAAIAAILMIVVNGADLRRAVGWVDFPTLALLFGLMVLSGLFGMSGFYDYCAYRITHARGSPQRLLAATIIVCAALSAVLANDIVAFAVPPLLCLGLVARRLDPIPFLIGLAAASNVGSAATVIGNPQNILIGQVGHLDFWRFLAVCGIPALTGLGIIHAVICWQWRGRWTLPEASEAGEATPPRLHRWSLIKALAITAALLIAFGVGAPRDLSALFAAAALFTSRRHETRALVGTVDWSLLILFGGLFIVTGVFADLPDTQQLFRDLVRQGWLPDRLSVLAPLTLLLSNTIGNVPSDILLLQVWRQPPQEALYALALMSTLAGNLLLTGSLANLIVAERAATVGSRLPFLAHAKAGIPITILTSTVAGLWLWLTGVVPF
ncbi:MAG TPA: SLC13 family permease [Methylomirabilota bacterium]|nr:SLC13 family permease [Methylomirabilota bacterium]